MTEKKMTEKKQIHIRASARLQRQLERLSIGGATITEIVSVAVDRMYAAETRQEYWWHWAIRSAGGQRAVEDAGVMVNIMRPYLGIPDPDDRYGYWRASPWIDPGEPSDGHLWSEKLDSLREQLGEDAGVFFIEHINHNTGPGMETRRSYEFQTLIAVSADGKRSAWERVG